ncbi:phospho-N-acetylmuramoyl-pentapeptide-transferase [Candidatus Saccharibacteria bacterium QS_5_54_17]|nr:MAG: phospho-N-acetylmuramoyl-pentapeptide-transferase [Candidatus Saccharibacteria bacterium QS_5_54_17]
MNSIFNQLPPPITIEPQMLSWLVLAALAGFVLAMALTPVYTYFAFTYEAWKRVRQSTTSGEKAPVFHKLHQEKHQRNIPTMAGVVIVVSVAVVTLLFNYDQAQTLLPLLALVAAGSVGLVDDLINIRGEGTGVAGLRSRLKFWLILSIAAGVSVYAFVKLGYVSLAVPFLGQVPLGWGLVPLFILVILASANAVNITDGLDGLAGGLSTIVFGVYSIIALLQGNMGIAVFCATVVGVMLSYTWFNIYPARFFMGDSGSFALGTTLGVIALLTDTVLLLPIIGAVFVLEAGSSSIQLLSKRLRGRKIFHSAPLHHHFEAMGWPETKVTMRFWVLGSVSGTIGLMIAIWGGQL